jgi:hypothetical protein
MSTWTRQEGIKIRSIIDKMDVCSCGSNAIWECILEILKEADSEAGSNFCRDKWIEFGAKALDSWGLLEHGQSIRSAWPTDDGRLLLRFITDFGLEGHNFNDGSGQPGWSIEFSWDDPGTDDDTFGRWLKEQA